MTFTAVYNKQQGCSPVSRHVCSQKPHPIAFGASHFPSVVPVQTGVVNSAEEAHLLPVAVPIFLCRSCSRMSSRQPPPVPCKNISTIFRSQYQPLQRSDIMTHRGINLMSFGLRSGGHTCGVESCLTRPAARWLHVAQAPPTPRSCRHPTCIQCL